jgi:hypothetical protein
VLPGARRLALWLAWLGIGLIGLTGRDVVGDTLHHYIGGYSAYVWLMLLLLALSVWLDRPPARAAAQ